MTKSVESSPADLAKAAQAFLQADTKSKWVASRSWGDKMWQSYDNAETYKWVAAKVATLILGLTVVGGIALLLNHIHNHMGYGMENKGEGFMPTLKSFTAKQGQLND